MHIQKVISDFLNKIRQTTKQGNRLASLSTKMRP